MTAARSQCSKSVKSATSANPQKLAKPVASVMVALAVPPAVPVLYVSLELGWETWKLAMATQAGDAPRVRTIAGRDIPALLQEIVSAKKKWGLAASAKVVTCYEAGRDGHWIHRALRAKGIVCHEVDSSSIEVNRQKRQVKSDRVDAEKLVSMLIRYESGRERQVWRVVRVPSEADEARRHRHRARADWKKQRTQHGNRIKSLLATQGVSATKVGPKFLDELARLRLWDGRPLPPELVERVRMEFAGWQFADRQIKDLENAQVRAVRRNPEATTTTEAKPTEATTTVDVTPRSGAQAKTDATSVSEEASLEPIRKLMTLKGIGLQGAWLFSREFFGWRRFENGRQVGAAAGLTPTPYASGSSRREQGIAKSGNHRVRSMAVEVAWMWLRYQPESKLTTWFNEKYKKGGSRLRKIGIVAVARKLLVALWTFLETGQVPEGAEQVPLEEKLRTRASMKWKE